MTGFKDSLLGEWHYGYDNLNRLTSAQGVTSGSGGSFPGITVSQATQSWIYDSFGNRWSQGAGTGSNQPPTEWAHYSGGGNNQITSNSDLPGGPIYDGHGRITNDGRKTYAYEAHGWLCSVGTPSPNSAYYQYIYDAEGRVITTGSRANTNCDLNTTTIADYIVDQNSRQLTELNSYGTWQHTNVFANGELLATYDGNGLHFALNDWLGDKRAQVSSTGVPELKCWNLPFNDAFGCGGTGTDATEHHFTGKEHDPYVSQLDHLGARSFTNYSGRFLSPDFNKTGDDPEPVPYADFEDPQSLNLYAYVGNNPLSRRDSTGHDGDPCKGIPNCVSVTATPEKGPDLTALVMAVGHHFIPQQVFQNFDRAGNAYRFLNKVTTGALKNAKLSNSYDKLHRALNRQTDKILRDLERDLGKSAEDFERGDWEKLGDRLQMAGEDVQAFNARLANLEPEARTLGEAFAEALAEIYPAAAEAGAATGAAAGAAAETGIIP